MKLLAAAIALCLAACAGPERQVSRALDAYRGAVTRSDMAAVTAMFAPSASLSHADEAPIIGDAAIGAFLATFAGFHVLDYRLAADSTRIVGDRAFQHGRYAESVLSPDGRRLDVSGIFDAAWQKQPDGRWRITRMHTAPEPQ